MLTQSSESLSIAVVISAFLTIYAYRDERVNGFSSEVIGELKKVTWPGKKETQTATVVVLWTAAILSVVMFVYDSVWAKVTGLIYK